ncbi:MAG: LacI family DNA-binding transcriptional regulator [Pyrinomonadaceae bacterium]
MGERLDLPAPARECDAFVCANDRVAGNLMHTLLAERRRIPQDVRLVGIDDVNYAALLPVPLTTVRQPCRDIGETALRVMLERLDRPQMSARDVLLDCELVIRESCGAKHS